MTDDSLEKKRRRGFSVAILPFLRIKICILSVSVSLPATSAAEASTWATTAWAPATGTGTARTTGASTTEDALGSAEEVQTIDDVEHGVARDGVVLGISTPHGRDNAGEC